MTDFPKQINVLGKIYQITYTPDRHARAEWSGRVTRYGVRGGIIWSKW